MDRQSQARPRPVHAPADRTAGP